MVLLPSNQVEKTAESTPDIQVALWSPTGKSIVFVHGNDIYYQRDASAPFSSIQRVTSNGKPGAVFNGVADWLYEGEFETSALSPFPISKKRRLVRFVRSGES